MELTCLHGFLGHPADWTFLEKENYELQTPTLEASASFADWQRRQGNFLKGDALIGYSLGGRLALHLLAVKSHFKKAIIVGAHFGNLTEQEKKDRLETDMVWAREFLEGPWESVIEKWNNQGVFKNSNTLVPMETDQSREKLASFLVNYSVAKQSNLLPALMKNNRTDILFVCGEVDEKYRELYEKWVPQIPRAELCIIPSAGHRAAFDQKETFKKQVRSFLGNKGEYL